MKKVIFILLMAFLTKVFSAEFADPEKCKTNVKAEEVTLFKELLRKSVTLGQSLCQKAEAALSRKQDFEFLDSSANVVAQDPLFIDFKTAVIDDIKSYFKTTSFGKELDLLAQDFTGFITRNDSQQKLPSMVVGGFSSTQKLVYFNHAPNQALTIDFTSEECIRIDCNTAFKQLTMAINEYSSIADRSEARIFYTQLSSNYKQWQRYLNESRSQTLTDTILTTWIEDDWFESYSIEKPLQRQWFLAHPSLVASYSSDAINGDKSANALAVEWIGVNWWDKESSPVNYPFGISIGSIYADRATIERHQTAIFFHFDNNLTIGYAKHNGEQTSVFVSVDFLQLLADKKSRWETYRSHFIERIQP